MQPDQMQTNSTTRAVSYDAGLRDYFRNVYNTMSIGLVLTGFVAYFVANTEALRTLFFGNPIISMVVMLAPLAFVFFGFSHSRVQRMSSSAVAGTFYAFSAIFGISLATVFMMYTGESIARVFFITAAMFAGTSVYGYTTKKDLAGLGGLLFMGVWGLLIAMIVNIFLQSTMLQFVISGVGVLVYTGLVAWDTQNLKLMYSASHGDEANRKTAVMGALSLYINFIMLFQFLMNLLGARRE